MDDKTEITITVKFRVLKDDLHVLINDLYRLEQEEGWTNWIERIDYPVTILPIETKSVVGY